MGVTSEDGGKFLKPRTKLSTVMTLPQFDNGYWYATELKEFAKTVGISANVGPTYNRPGLYLPPPYDAERSVG